VREAWCLWTARLLAMCVTPSSLFMRMRRERDCYLQAQRSSFPLKGKGASLSMAAIACDAEPGSQRL
jgi:hypothetical protein